MAIDPRHEYTTRLALRRAAYARLDRSERLLAYARGAAFAAGIAVLWLSAGNGMISNWWLLAPLFVFAALVLRHDRVIRSKALVGRAVKFYERGLIRIDDGWPAGEEPFVPEIDPAHAYGADLDLFGRESLYERLSAARTSAGRRTLGDWLLQPAVPEVIRARQAAVAELRPLMDLREDLAVLGPDVPSGAGSPMLRWAAQKASPIGAAARAAALVLVAAALLLLYGWLVWKWNANLFAAVLFVEWLFARRYRPLAKAVGRDLDRAGEELALLSPVLVRLERESFSAPLLASLRGRLEKGGVVASRQIARIRKLIEMLDSMRNPYFAPLGALLLWRTQITFELEAWRAQNGPSVAAWLDAVAEMEALSSFAQSSFDHPEDPFPEIAEEGPSFDGEDIGHPLLPRKSCVRNTLKLNPEMRLLVVSGSNMSGKSTLLRTIGVNTVLALAGATVCASRLRVSPLAVGVSLHVVDSLQSGASHFYAEIKRLRRLMDVAAGPLPLLFLLDEILHGTNSADRLTGAEAVVRGYLERGAMGLITTHDLALARMADSLAPRAANVHFEDHMEDGRIAFDYRLHSGVIRKSNAIALMRAVGLEV